MSERRREIAILRALGARRATIFSIVLLEPWTICLVGSAAGLIAIWSTRNGSYQGPSGVGHSPGGFPSRCRFFLEWYNLVVAWCWCHQRAWAGVGTYRTDVAKNLAPSS